MQEGQASRIEAVRKGRPRGATSFDAPAAKAFGQALRKIRIERGLSQEQLALRAGVAPTFLGQVERGENQASFGVILKVSRTLGVSAALLVSQAEALL